MLTVQQRINTGIVWMVAARLMDRGIGVLSTLILARLLIPADFGLVAMATAIGGILDLLGAFSFELALIQNKTADKAHYDTVWTFNALFGLFCAAALVALAIPASAFYHEPRLEAVMYALSCTYVVGGFSNVGVVNFRKELAFRDEFNFIFLKRVITFFVTVGCAYELRSYWALVAGMVVGRVASVYLSYKMSNYRPRLTLSARNELFHFSKWLFINNILFFLLHSGPNFIVGRINGALGLGIYTVSYEISNLPSTELVAPINRVTFPGFSKMGSTEVMAASYLKLLGMITLLILPVGMGIAALAEPIVWVTLGANWRPAIPLIQLLGIYGAIAATQTNNSVVWMVLGRTKDIAVNTILFLAVFFPALYFFLTEADILGVGYAYLLAQVISTPTGLWNTKTLLGLSWNKMGGAVWRPIIASALMYEAVSLLDEHLSNLGVVLRLCSGSLFGFLVYSFVILTLWFLARKPAGAESFCLERSRNALISMTRNLQ